MAKLKLEIRKGQRLLGSWTLGEEPLELVLSDAQTGQALASLSATSLVRVDPAAPEDEVTSPQNPPMVPAQALVPSPADEETLIRRRPRVLHRPPASVAQVEVEDTEEVSLSLPLPEPLGRPKGDDLTLPLPDEDSPTKPRRIQRTVRPSNVRRRVRPAEVWRYRHQTWTAAGTLAPGQQILALGGRIRLTENGALMVRCGDRLKGSAVLPDGRKRPLPSGDHVYRLPPRSNLTLRTRDEGIYIRTAVDDNPRRERSEIAPF